MIKKLLSMLPLDGNKTYIVGLVAVGMGIWSDNTELIFLGLGLLGLRHSQDK